MPTKKTQDKIIEYKDRAKETVKIRPFQSLGVAFGVGVLLGVIVTAAALRRCD